MPKLSKIADRIETVRAYSAKELGARFVGVSGELRNPDARVILVNEKWRDLIVAALRAVDADA